MPPPGFHLSMHWRLRSDRIVIGAASETAAQQVARLYRALSAPVVLTTTASAEMAKYAANCFLAMRLSYINEVAGQCERFGADIGGVWAVMGYDQHSPHRRGRDGSAPCCAPASPSQAAPCA